MSEGLLAAGLLTASQLTAASAYSQTENDRDTVARLDLAYQAAVKRNDAMAMDQIPHDDFALVLGDGKVISRELLLEAARNKTIAYSRQDEVPGTQVVRVWGDTAVVTALLWVKGAQGEKSLDRRLWFSDTYVRTSKGWRYAFAQASLPLGKC